jgi:hypothetical protein
MVGVRAIREYRLRARGSRTGIGFVGALNLLREAGNLLVDAEIGKRGRVVRQFSFGTAYFGPS